MCYICIYQEILKYFQNNLFNPYVHYSFHIIEKGTAGCKNFRVNLVRLDESAGGQKRGTTKGEVKVKKRKNVKEGFGSRQESPVQVPPQNNLVNEQPPRIETHQNTPSTAGSNGKQAGIKGKISGTQVVDVCNVAGGKKRKAPQESVEAKKQKNNSEGTVCSGQIFTNNNVQVVSQNELANKPLIRDEGQHKSAIGTEDESLMSETQAEDTNHQGDHVLQSNSMKKRSKKDYRALMSESTRSLRSHNKL